MDRRDFVRHTTVAGTVLAVGPSFSCAGSDLPPDGRSRLDFNPGWRFQRGDSAEGFAAELDDRSWDSVSLPHAARVEPLVTGPPGSDSYQWQGVCWYRKRFVLRPEAAGRSVAVLFDGAMNVAEVWLNGRFLGRHLGGWLPFGFDITGEIELAGENVLAVRLDNRDDPVTGPKPLSQLDFNFYHGIYRSVTLLVKDSLHITDPILADRPASGGVFVSCPEVSSERARVRAQIHVRNTGDVAREFRLRQRLVDAEGRVVARAVSNPTRLDSSEDQDLVQDLTVAEPAFWSPRSPALYRLHTELVEDGIVVDQERTRIGIRHLEISAEGFRINGEPMFLRGTNRHQEYPYIGYALSDAAQYRDAQKIKDAGFDYVRLSHYPHAPAFMDACDELGLVVMNCIPGWQFFNHEDPAFTELQYENSRLLVRRDRNHPCVILWEVSLNETSMPQEFIRTTHAIAHEELPGDQCFT